LKRSVTYLQVMTLPCILVMRQQHILASCCVYFQTNLLTGINQGFCIFLYGIHAISQ
jgi:hypothetical protein